MNIPETRTAVFKAIKDLVGVREVPRAPKAEGGIAKGSSIILATGITTYGTPKSSITLPSFGSIGSSALRNLLE